MKKQKTPSPYKKFAALSDAEKEHVYRECDDPNITRRAKPLSPAMKKLWSRAQNKGGRPRIGRGAARVLISVERGLLEDADSFARRQHLTRSQLFTQGVKTILKKAG